MSGAFATWGFLLYDADRLEEVAKLPDDQLVEGQRSLILDPHDPAVIDAGEEMMASRMVFIAVGAEGHPYIAS